MGFLNLYCTRTKYVCSAYQSAFFVDDKVASEFFEGKKGIDSLPLVSGRDMVRMNQYLLIEPMSRKKKEKSWKIVPMILIVPPKAPVDSLLLAKEDSLRKAEEMEDIEPVDTTEMKLENLPPEDTTEIGATP